ncbi:MAG: SGNH/GDSL hydrolase family protein [Chryseolinea sp.]
MQTYYCKAQYLSQDEFASLTNFDAGTIYFVDGVLQRIGAGGAALERSKTQNLLGLFVGDSLVANGYYTDAVSTTAQNLIMTADMEMGGVLGHLENGGVSGNRTDQMLARLPALLAAAYYDIIFFGPNSVNDVSGNNLPAPMLASQTISNYSQMLALCFAQPSVKRVIILRPHRPASTVVAAVSAAGDAARLWYKQVNDYLTSLATTDPRIMVVDWGGAVTNAAGSALRTNFNVDPTHVNYLGTREGANTAVKAALSSLPFLPWSMSSTMTDYNNLLGPSSMLVGSFAAGSGGVVFNTGFTGTSCPGGLLARRMPGDTSTGANITSVASAVGLDSPAAQMDYTIGVDTGACGFSVGTVGGYSTPRANSTAYTWGQHLQIPNNTLLGLQLFTPGVSAAASPDFSNAKEGQFIQDGGAVWLVSRIPQYGDVLQFDVDLNIVSCTAGSKGGVVPFVWIVFVDNLGNQVTRYINFSGVAGGAYWPTATGRRQLRRKFTVPAMAGSYLTNVNVFCGVQGAAGATGTFQLNRASAVKVG